MINHVWKGMVKCDQPRHFLPLKLASPRRRAATAHNTHMKEKRVATAVDRWAALREALLAWLGRALAGSTQPVACR